MAKVDVGAVAERLFVHFMAPVVLGGEVRPGKPIGGKVALSMGEARSVVDNELMSRSQLARVRIARKIAPIDVLLEPTIAEWALAAVLHDIVQSTHPEWSGLFRSSAPSRILELAGLTLERISAPASVGEALSRHSWFSRALEIGRTDTKVSWWVGSQTFLGTEPPKRLQAWPELRRVQIDKTVHPLCDLPSNGGRVRAELFATTLAAFMGRTPLTDLATCARPLPQFAWTRETLSLLATRAGRTLAVRALEQGNGPEIDAALGRATRPLVGARAVHALVVVLGLLGERAMAAAEERLLKNEAPLFSATPEDLSFGRALGAWAAMQQIAVHGEAFSQHARAALLGQLRVLAPEPMLASVATLIGANAA